MRHLLGSLCCVLMTAPAFAADKDIVDTAVAAGQFNTLATAIQAAGLVDTLKGPGPFTVFAPTDEAFAKLPPSTVEDLLKPENKGKLTKILTYHVLAGRVPASEAVKLDGQSAQTVAGVPLPVSVRDGEVLVGPAAVVKTDIEATNGIIHVIDTVLLPPASPPVPTAVATAVPAMTYAATVHTYAAPAGAYTVAAPAYAYPAPARGARGGGMLRRWGGRTCH